LREYYWPVSGHVGQLLRIALIDRDTRPGCHLICSGFQFVPQEDFDGRLFAEQMLELTGKHHLSPLARFDSKHFLALSNASDEYTEHRLYNCETMYAQFFDHFRRKGFAVREPGTKLMVAIFDSQAGFEAYLGQRMSSAVTGVYHRPTNRLVVYDYASNREFMAQKALADEQLKQLPFSLQKQRLVSDFRQQIRDRRNDANIGTVMHEVAHQLSFNGGLLNRDGDAGIWLVEGLACYCEATSNGDWQGIGEPNPQRLNVLASIIRADGPFIPVRELIHSDDWLDRATVQQALLGYAQSWALYRMLMEQRPQALRKYLALIYPRRAADHRLIDFAQIFGTDLDTFDKQYRAYVRNLVRQEARPAK
jgi:hypothetical protein